MRRKRRKHKTKQCLREVKKRWRLFEQTSIDTKQLCDIPELWPQLQRHHLPLHQYTAREVTSGWHYVSYAQECTLAYSKLFAEIIITHLKDCGVKFKASRFQTDNGCEFVGNWQAKADSKFTEAVDSVKGLRHTTCPVRAHTWQADVETVHRLIEDEFYEVERFSSRGEFLEKARAYNLWFNVGRRNSGKEHRTPWEIIREKEPKVSAAICALPPVFLDELFMKKLDAKLLWGTILFPIPLVDRAAHAGRLDKSANAWNRVSCGTSRTLTEEKIQGIKRGSGILVSNDALISPKSPLFASLCSIAE